MHSFINSFSFWSQGNCFVGHFEGYLIFRQPLTTYTISFWTDLGLVRYWGVALKWIVSYPTKRCQTITIQGKFLVPMSLIYRVPQGSVLGPLLFILYTTPLSKIISNHKDLQHQLHADDTQFYNSFKTTSNFWSSIDNLQQCLLSVQEWMFTNMLKLNPDNTEFMLIGNKCHQKKFNSCLNVKILSNPASHAQIFFFIFNIFFYY